MKKLSGIFKEGVKEGIYPGAVLLVAKEGEVVFLEEAGYRCLIPEQTAMEKDTIFDLASLTKPLATTLAVMKLVYTGKLDLNEVLDDIFEGIDLKDKSTLTPRLLLCHSAGLTDWKPFYEKLIDHPPEERKQIVRSWIIEEPFAYKPGTGNLYSDLGFMLLEWVIEKRAGEGLAEYVEREFYVLLGLKRTFFSENPPHPPFTKGGGFKEGSFTRGGKKGKGGNTGQDQRSPSFKNSCRAEEFAATEECPWRKRVLRGEVHDDNAWTLGGYSGHAGLFGTAQEVYVIVDMLREHYLGRRSDFFKPETVREFFRRQNIVKASDWALGWDTRALEGSSAGRHFSRNSVGHTGFTGTSIWMDLEKDVVAILLTNRVHPTRSNDKIKAFRPRIHDLIMEELGCD